MCRCPARSHADLRAWRSGVPTWRDLPGIEFDHHLIDLGGNTTFVNCEPHQRECACLVSDRALRRSGIPRLLAIQAEANIKVVQSMMGHVSATMTWDLYGHLYDEDLDQVADRLGEVRERFLHTPCGLPADQGPTVVQLA